MLRLTAAFALLLASCGTTYETPMVDRGQVGQAQGTITSVQAASPSRRAYAQARADWNRVIPRVKAMSDGFCREENPGRPRAHCDFAIRLIEDRRQPPNAFQTMGRDGRPLIVMTSALLADTRSADEIAFVMSHEAAHHIAGHLQRQQANVLAGALILGTLAAATLGSNAPDGDRIVADAMDLGAFAGQRAYSQRFELEADTLGSFIAFRAGYSPESGALMFARTPSAVGPASLWSTHPPSPQRLAVVNRAAEEIRRQQSLGMTPRPAQSRGRL